MDLAYIIQNKLSNRSSTRQLNSHRTDQDRVGPGRKLPLFSKLEKPEKWIQKLYTNYGEDMDMFGYSYKISDGQVFATCKHYTQTGICI